MIKDLANRSATALWTFGALGVLWGLMMALWPGLSTVTFAVIWGAYALIDGVGSLIMAAKEKEGRGWYLLSGLLGVVAGVVVVLRPGIGVASVAWILGLWLLIRGAAEIIAAVALDRTADKLLVGAGGVLWIIAGFVVMANPAEAALALTWLLGVLAVSWGIVLIVAGFRARSLATTAGLRV
ncbi:MAG: DUF308 domain-containing protein [Actinomyces bowdenii]|nr:DUF308 domain-containing protein [Actinomyces bowdenii]